MPPRAGTFARMRASLTAFFWPNSDPKTPGAGAQNPEDEYKLFKKDLDKKGFSWIVFLVAGSGFCTDSYNLFASNVVLPALGYVYWYQDMNSAKPLAFNLATLGASALGQLLFGLLADLVGRRSLYGIELVIVIVSTLGLLQCSEGYNDPNNDGQYTWHITPWVIFWRCVMGLGIGAEYPLSACIAAEWSSTKWRARTMSAVFLMQPIGQLSAYGAGLTGLQIYSGSRLGIDKLWRYVVGIGAIPTLLALFSRLIMPEGGRYFYEVTETARLVGEGSRSNTGMTETMTTYRTELKSTSEDEELGRHTPHFESLWDYFYHEGHWIYLVGTSACWFFLDFAFYGIGFNNPSTLAKIWAPNHLNFPPGSPGWLTMSSLQVPANITLTSNVQEVLIRQVLKTNMTHAIYTVSIASIVGSLCMVAFIDFFHRRHMLTVTFAALGLLMIIVAACFQRLFHNGDVHVVLIVFWIVISFLFSFGPNTLTFIFPAEVFPTRYRCTFYGIAAASGKIGALLAQAVIYRKDVVDVNKSTFRWALLGFGVCMLLGALCSHFTLPDVQKHAREPPPWYENVPLEDLPPLPPDWTRGTHKRVDSDPETGMETGDTTLIAHDE